MSNGNVGNSTSESIMESQNNDRIDLLSEQVSHLKSLTVSIGSEVTDQNNLLDSMDTGFSSTRDLLTSSVARIGTMMGATSSKHMFYLAGFVVVITVFLYWSMK